MIAQLDSLQRLKEVFCSMEENVRRFDFVFSLQVGWYWGPLSWLDAERLLKDKQDYSFLVRDSNHRHYFLAVTFKSQGNIHHTRIEHNNSSLSNETCLRLIAVFCRFIWFFR